MEAPENYPPADPQGGYYLSSTYLVFGLGAWHALYKLALLGYRRFFPNHHGFLLGNKGDLRVEFFILELFAYPTVLYNIYSCAEAFLETDPALDMAHSRMPMSWAGQKCIGSRLFQYITEIGFEREWTQTFTHHLVTIAGLPPLLAFGAPRRQMYITMLSLAVEPLGTNLRLFALYNDWRAHRPRLDYATRLSQFLGWTLVRLPCHLYTFALIVLWSGGAPAERALMGYGHVLFLLYSFGIVGRFAGRLGFWNFGRRPPAAAASWVLFGRYRYSFLGFALYAGGALLVLATPALARFADGTDVGAGFSNWASTSVQAFCLVAVPYFLRYFWRSEKDLVENPRQVTLEQMYMAAAALNTYISGKTGAMLPSLMLNNLLQEALAHLGCYLEELYDESSATSSGASPSETHEGETGKDAAPMPAPTRRSATPTHLLACAALLAVYLSLGALVLSGDVTLGQAACLAAINRGLIKGLAFGTRAAQLRAAPPTPPRRPPLVDRALGRLASVQVVAGTVSLAAVYAKPLACALPQLAALAAAGAVLLAARSAQVRAVLRFVTAWKTGQALVWAVMFVWGFYYGLFQMESYYADHVRRQAAGLVNPATAPSDPWAYVTPAMLTIGLAVLPGLLSY